MKLKLIITLIAGMSLASQAQDFSDMQWQHELGYEFAVSYPTTPNAGGEYMYLINGIAYKPAYMMPVGHEMSVGLTAPVSVGFTGDAGMLGVSYALAAQVSAGMGSTIASTAPVGMFMALGGGSYDIYPLFYDLESVSLYGAYMNLGCRFYYYGSPTTLSVGGWWNANPVVGDYRMAVLRMTYALNY